MALHIAFEKSADTLLKKLVRLMSGQYVHTELIVTQPPSSREDTEERLVHTGYTAFMYETFTRIFQKDFWYDDASHDFLHVPMSPEELGRTSQACEACVESRLPYNTMDMALSQLPLRSPTEHDLFHTETLFCSQAVVLILRSSLDQSHPIQAPLSLVNSRTISPTGLFNLLRPYCPMRVRTEVLSGARRLTADESP